jgi:hypothetical protein
VDKVRPIRPIIVTCSCGKTYDRVTWRKLAFVGVQVGDDGKPVELRNCDACKSTRARGIDFPVLVELLHDVAHRLNVVSQKLIDSVSDVREKERERCARIAEKVARDAVADRYRPVCVSVDGPSLSSEMKHFARYASAEVARHIAERIRES